MAIYLHKGDLPASVTFENTVAVDTETLGLRPLRDRLCVVQLSAGDGDAHLVQIARGQHEAPHLVATLSNPAILKVFHFARFDLGVLYHYLGVDVAPVYCTKIASRLTRTYTDRHGLKDLVKELLDTDLSKQQQSSDWGADTLSDAQQSYAAADVLYLHALKAKLDAALEREERREIADACFAFLPTRARLDLAGWADEDIFAHS
ncbi:MAG: ribonuclease D [Hyphomicrobiales bacterium]|nr:ribonuclease D [Hyphomicrobiales bacterium]